MKILYVNGSFGNESGCPVIAYNTYKLFERKGHDVAAFCAKGFFPEKDYKYEKYFTNCYDSVKGYLLHPIKYYYNKDAAINLKIIIDDFKPDIIHIHSMTYSALTYSILKPCTETEVPIVQTLHDSFLICPMATLIKGNGEICNGICKDFRQYNCILNNCGPKGIEQSIRWAILNFVSSLTNYNKYITQYITPSNALKSLLVSADIGINEEKISVINNFLSDEELQTIPNFENKNYFLYIGRLTKEKGLHYLLETMKDLPREIEVHIVGKGNEEENLKRYIKEYNLDNVKFLGFKNREEIKEEYQNCIATILPCNWFENFPTTNMESFINGKPIIASNIGGIPEQIEDNKTGLLFEPANIKQLKECILKYWNDSELAITHGKNGYNKAKTLYTAERYYNQLVNIYKEVLNEN